MAEPVKEQSYYDTLKILTNIAKKHPILNKKMERAMIDKYRDNRNFLNEKLVNHNIRIVIHTSKSYINRTPRPADMLLDGYLGLRIAADRFDLDRNIKFNTYATPWVFKYIMTHFYSKSPEVGVNSYSMDEFISNNLGDDDNTTKLDLIDLQDYSVDFIDRITPIDSEKEINKIFLKNIIDTVISDLNISDDSLEKSIIYRNMIGGESLTKISAEFNVKYSHANSEKKYLTAKMKELLAIKGIDSLKDVL